jgi:hypothetical protein
MHSELRIFPGGFFDSFDYTTSGNNFCHPLTLGALVRVVWNLRGVAAVGIDVRFNSGGGVKFQPDVVAFDRDRQPLVAIDYESPNSSDARIPWKDVDAYLSWNSGQRLSLPYIIITTLPDRQADGWELRYVHGKGYNADFRGREKEVRANPYRFWLAYYSEQFKSRNMEWISLINIDRGNPHRAFPGG